MRRRTFLALSLLPFPALGAKVDYPAVQPNTRLQFPRDHGAHPEFRIEWWYVTGWLDGPLGFQITFFRARPEEASDNPSAFNPRRSSSRTRRSAIRSAAAWSTTSARRAPAFRSRTPSSSAPAYGSTTGGSSFTATATKHTLRPRFRVRFPPPRASARAAGGAGLQPQGPPAARGELLLQPPAAQPGRQAERPGHRGTAWLDHEWSSAYMAPEAAGWDWCGINFSDGGSLMAFRMRDRNGGVHFTSPGSTFRPENVDLAAHRRPVSGGDGGQRPRPQAAHGRPGARLAREHRDDLLGGCCYCS